MKNEILSLLTEHPVGGLELLDPQSSLTKWVVQYEKEYGELPTTALFVEEFFPEEKELTPSAPWSYYQEKLEQAKLVRDLQPAFDSFSALYTESPYKASEKLVEQILLLDKDRVTTQGVTTLNDGQARWDFFTSPQSKRLLTGLAPLDDATGGLSCADDLMVISARTGVGKSWLGHYILMQVALHGHNVGLYSGEMSKEEVGARLDSLLLHVSNWQLTRGKITDFNLLKQAWDEVKGRIDIITTKELKRYARPSDIKKFVKARGLELVVLDQLSLMQPDGTKFNNEVSEKYALSSQLKILQQSLCIPFIIISQLNRGAEGVDPTTANLAGSDGFGNDSTVALALTRPSQDTLKIKVMKARGYRMPDSAWEFTWDVDRGVLTYQQSKLDKMKTKVGVAKVKDEEIQNDEDEEII